MRRASRCFAVGLAAVLSIALTLWLAACSSSGGGRVAGPAEGWSAGPVRWLLLPQEARQFRRLKGSPKALAFIENFWRRRDPEPHLPENSFAETFFERVAAADRIYAEGNVRGSLTDRGRALVLLGSPDLLRYTSRAVPALQGRQAAPRFGAATRTARIEIWGYRWETLAPELQALVPAPSEGDYVMVSFVDEAQRTRLIAGENLLEDAARAAVRR